MAQGKHAKARSGAHAKKTERRLLTKAGYPLGFVALLALAIGPGYAIATEAGAGAASGSEASQQVSDASQQASGASEQASGAPEQASDASEQASGASVASAKDETVYVFAKADGSVKNVEVSDKLTNADKASRLADSSTLANIENMEGDEAFSGSGSGMVWDAGGNDIYYRGDSDQELPVAMSVLYKLDGRAVSADELAGKSGKVEIAYSFQNKTESQNGVQVPLAAITGMLLDNDSFSDIEVDNGRVIDDGDRTVVVGYALPGLAESLDVDADTIDIPSSFTVSAQTSDFELGSTLTMVTGNLFDSVNMDDFDTSELSDASGSLKDAMSQLIDGSGQLADGMSTLQDKTDALPDGVQQLYDGSSDLTGYLNQAADGTEQLASGATTLSGYIDRIAGGLAQAQSGASELSEGLAELPGTLGSLKTDLSTAKAASDGATQTIAVASSTLQGIASSTADAGLKQELLQVIAMLGDAQLPTGTYGASYYTEEISAGMEEAVAGIAAKEPGVAKAVEGAASLSTSLGALSESAQQVSGGMSDLSSNMSDLNTNMSGLASGSGTITEGLGTLNASTEPLIAGIAQLVEGTAQLNEGLVQFNDEGIAKITDFLDGDLLQATNNLEAVRDAGENYTNFSGITEGTAGTVKFVIEAEAIEKDD